MSQTPTNIIGPHSPWPRQPRKTRIKRPAILAGSAAFAAVVLHCGVPMLF